MKREVHETKRLLLKDKLDILKDCNSENYVKYWKLPQTNYTTFPYLVPEQYEKHHHRHTSLSSQSSHMASYMYQTFGEKNVYSIKLQNT